MQFIEHRRHARRDKPSPHINQKSIKKCVRLEKNMGPFEKVITSQHARASETAVALGFAVTKERAELNDLPDAFSDLWKSSPQAWHRQLKKCPRLSAYCRKMSRILMRELDDLGRGQSILIISHGGVIEACLWGALLGTPFEKKFLKLKSPFRFCHGYRIAHSKGRLYELKWV